MKTPFHIRWGVAIGLWTLVLAATGWNTTTMDKIAASRQENERMGQEALFQRQNTLKLGHIVALHDAMQLTVESVDLALVEAASRIGSLSRQFGMEPPAMHHQLPQTSEAPVSYNVNLQGSLGQTIGFITALHHHPYLEVRRITFQRAAESDGVQMEIDLHLHYRLVSMGDGGEMIDPYSLPQKASLL